MRPKGATKNAACLADPNYQPNRMFNVVMEQLGLVSDRQLADALDCMPGVISRMRHHRLSISAPMILAIQDVTGMTLPEVLRLAGMPRPCEQGRKDELVSGR